MKQIILAILLVFLVGCTATVVKNNTQMANPASMNCVNQGYKLEIRDTSEGQTGYCIFSEGKPKLECEEWAYFRGECNPCVEYCKTQPHIQCVGTWNITGKYPDCKCGFDCSEG